MHDVCMNRKDTAYKVKLFIFNCLLFFLLPLCTIILQLLPIVNDNFDRTIVIVLLQLQFAVCALCSFNNFCIQNKKGASIKGKGQRNLQATGQSQFTCNQCGKQYTSQSSLKRHMQLHTGQYRYHCDICRKGFNTSTHYKLHMRSHEGIKYYCQYCGKSFVSKQKHDYHLSVHTGQYRFRCDRCSGGFNEKRIFTEHVERCF